jgi:AraC-like DNA-binding protein
MPAPHEQHAIGPVSVGEVIRLGQALTDNVRVELLSCGIGSTVRWNVTRPEAALMWVRDKGSNAQIRISGLPDGISAGRTRFCFFPEGFDAECELSGKAAYDCAGVFVAPGFIPPAAKQALDQPIAGFSHDALGRAFDFFARELTASAEVMPAFTEAWASLALTCVAHTANAKAKGPAAAGSCLAPWQLRTATGVLRAHLAENLPLARVAETCRLSVSHFARAFKASTGLPPHQWILTTRVERARELLASSGTPLAEVAVMCGFTDQSHFSRVFARVVGTSPGVWRRQHGLARKD